MKPNLFMYKKASSISEGIKLMHEAGEGGKFIAGGQSLIPAMNLRMASPTTLINIAEIQELKKIEFQNDGSVLIGAGVTQNELLAHKKLRDKFPIIYNVVRAIAHESVRNRSTVGGSLSHADPAAEWPALAIFLNAKLHLYGLSGERVITASQFIIGIYETALNPDEILTHIEIPFSAKTDVLWGFDEIARRIGDFALAGSLVALTVKENNLLEYIRVTVFGAEDLPLLFEEELAPYLDQECSPTLFAEIAAAVSIMVQPRSDLHADAELRSDLVESVALKALCQAYSNN